jgi:hypothetical protein
MENPKLPVRFSPRPVEMRRPRFIIIHSSKCQSLNSQPLHSITQEYSFGKLKKETLQYQKMIHLPYHFLFDKIGQDYEVQVGTPFNIHLDFLDINELYDRAIHIALLFDMDVTTMDDRGYEALAYKIIVPLAYWLSIPKNNIYLHSEVMKNQLYNCPGSFFDKTKFFSFIQKFWTTSIK